MKTTFNAMTLDAARATDPAAAFEVLKKCAQKLGSTESISIRWDDGQWAVADGGGIEYVEASLEDAIAKFAKALFSK